MSVRFNAPLFVGGLAGVAVDAVKNGSTPIAVKLGSDTFVNPGCKPKSQHEAASSGDGDWPADANDLKIRIPAGAIRMRRKGAYAAGRHSIGSEIVLNVSSRPRAAQRTSKRRCAPGHRSAPNLRQRSQRLDPSRAAMRSRKQKRF